MTGEMLDRVFNVIYAHDPMTDSSVDAAHKVCEIVTIELGKDCMELGIVPFLTRLVGEDNVERLFERHAGEAP